MKFCFSVCNSWKHQLLRFTNYIKDLKALTKASAYNSTPVDHKSQKHHTGRKKKHTVPKKQSSDYYFDRYYCNVSPINSTVCVTSSCYPKEWRGRATTAPKSILTARVPIPKFIDQNVFSELDPNLSWFFIKVANYSWIHDILKLCSWTLTLSQSA